VTVAAAREPLGTQFAATARRPLSHILDAFSVGTVSPRLARRTICTGPALVATLCNHLLRGAFAVLALEPILAEPTITTFVPHVNAELLANALRARQTGEASGPGSAARLATSGGRRRRSCAFAVLAIQSGLANFAITAVLARLNSFLSTLAVFASRPAHARTVILSACAAKWRVGGVVVVGRRKSRREKSKGHDGHSGFSHCWKD
jgi:hypothetical protein